MGLKRYPETNFSNEFKKLLEKESGKVKQPKIIQLAVWGNSTLVILDSEGTIWERGRFGKENPRTLLQEWEWKEINGPFKKGEYELSVKTVTSVGKKND